MGASTFNGIVLFCSSITFFSSTICKINWPIFIDYCTSSPRLFRQKYFSVGSKGNINLGLTVFSGKRIPWNILNEVWWEKTNTHVLCLQQQPPHGLGHCWNSVKVNGMNVQMNGFNKWKNIRKRLRELDKCCLVAKVMSDS